MKIIASLFAFALFSTAAVTHAADFPKGSPAFETSLTTGLADAKKEEKPVIAIFSAVWCGPCQEMKKDVYPSDVIKPFHDKFEWIYLDADDAANEKAMTEFGVTGIPHIQFLDKNGKSLGQQVGGTSPEAFAKKLAGVLSKSKK